MSDITDVNENKDEKMKTAAKAGVSFGSVLAIVISFTTYQSIPWAILHGILGWIFVIYYAFLR